MVCVTMQEFTVTCIVSALSGDKNCLVTKMGRANKFKTSSAHSHLHCTALHTIVGD